MSDNLKYKAQGTIEEIGDQGLVTAKIAHFGNYDREQDRVFKGAFEIPFANLATRPIPVYPKHREFNPLNWAGDVMKAWEADDGAYIEAQLHMDEEVGSTIFKRLKAGTLRDWSYWASVKTKAKNSRGGDDIKAYEDVREASPAALGMNPLAGTMKVAGAQDSDVKLSTPPGEGEDVETERARLRVRLAAL